MSNLILRKFALEHPYYSTLPLTMPVPATPNRVPSFTSPAIDLMKRPSPSFNPHNFRRDHAVHAGRIIFQDAFPQDIPVFLIEVFDTAFGENLSPTVAPSVEKTCAMIISFIHESSHTPLPTYQPPTL